MRQFLFVLAAVLITSDVAFASQGPGTGPGTAGPMLQWLAAICGIALATLGVVFSRWDDGKYKDF